MIFILCGTFCVAQNTVSKERYEKWVDYVNCKYLVAFIDKKISQRHSEISDNYKQDYDKNKSKLNVDLPDKALNYDDIKKIIGEFPKGEQLHKYINAKKDKLDKNWNKDALIEYLLDLPTDQPSKEGNGFKGYLADGTNSLKTDLQKQISDDFFTEHQTVENENQKQEEVEDTLQHDPKRNSKNVKDFPWHWLILAVFIVAVIWKRKWLKEQLLSSSSKNKAIQTPVIDEVQEIPEKPEKTVLQTEDLEKVFKWILSDDKKFSAFLNIILKNEQFLSLLVKNSLKYPEIRKMLEEELLLKENAADTKVHAEKPVVHSTAVPATTLYADSIFDGFFNKTKETPNEETVFELHLHNAQNATFTIYHSAKQRIIANPAFLEGCDKQVLANGQNVKIANEGVAQRQSDGKWKVISKLNVIIN
jgi:hypothetical protein